MRFTKKVAVWPVGLITQLRAEGCIVTNGKVRKTPAVVIHGEGITVRSGSVSVGAIGFMSIRNKYRCTLVNPNFCPADTW